MAIRVLMLNDDNHAPSYHCEDTSHWYDANNFISYLTRPRTLTIHYEVRQVRLADLDPHALKEDINDIERYFDIVIYFDSRSYSFEEYQEVFNILWKYSEEI